MTRMRAIAVLLAVTRAHFSAKTPTAEPASPLNPPARCSTSHFAHEAAKPRFIKDQSMFSLANSPLADAADLSPRAVDAILAVFADGEVQRHAAEVRGKLLRLVEFAVLRSEIAAAVKTIGHSAAELTPLAVVGVLRQRAAELDDALVDAREDRDAHEAARKARMASMEPLKREVSKRMTALVADRESCLSRLDAHRRAASMGFPANSRYHALIAAGIKPEEIAGLNVEDPDQIAVKLRARVAAVDEELAPLRRFSLSGNPDDLAGAGLDSLVSLAYPDRVAAEVAA